jgi:dnd system-associated protein 4
MEERSVYRPAIFDEKLIPSLKKDKDNTFEDAPFETFAHVMCFAAALGVMENSHEFNTEFKRGEAIPFKVFKNNGLESIINILAITRGKDLNILTGSNGGDEKIKIFEGYAYAGLKLLNETILTRTGNSNTGNLILVVQQFINRSKGDSQKEIDLKAFMS